MDRYINITRPLRYPVILSMRRTYLLVAATWSLALLLGGLVFLAVQLQPGHVCTYSFSVDRFSGLTFPLHSRCAPRIVLKCAALVCQDELLPS